MLQLSVANSQSVVGVHLVAAIVAIVRASAMAQLFPSPLELHCFDLVGSSRAVFPPEKSTTASSLRFASPTARRTRQYVSREGSISPIGKLPRTITAVFAVLPRLRTRKGNKRRARGRSDKKADKEEEEGEKNGSKVSLTPQLRLLCETLPFPHLLHLF